MGEGEARLRGGGGRGDERLGGCGACHIRASRLRESWHSLHPRV